MSTNVFKGVIPYYGIRELGHRQIQTIFDSDVVIEEKVDGSQISFGVFNGNLEITSRRQPIVGDNGMWQQAKSSIEAMKDLLVDGWIYRGEYLKSPRHNRIAYKRTPKNHIIIWDIETSPNCFLTVKEREIEANRIGLESIPVLFEGKVDSQQQLKDLLDRTSYFGDEVKIEGIVIKNYSLEIHGHLMLAKFVSEDFQEKMSKGRRSSSKPKVSFVQELIDELTTEARWHKAVQHLKEAGEIKGEVEDIALLIKEIQKDVYEECEDYIREFLFEKSKREIQKGIVKGFASWYKEMIFQELKFNEEGETDIEREKL